MPARSWSCCLFLGLLVPAAAAAKPPDLPVDPRVSCVPAPPAPLHPAADAGPECVLVPWGVPGFAPSPMGPAEVPAYPLPRRRYPDGNVLLKGVLFGLHPATLLFPTRAVLHCDDDEPAPVLEVGGRAFDLADLLARDSTAACSAESTVTTPCQPPAAECPKAAAPKDETPVCPYLQKQPAQKDEAGQLDGDLFTNVEKLEQAARAYQQAEFFRKLGHSGSAWFYYEVTRRLCPGSRYDQMAAEKLAQMKADVDPNTRRARQLIDESEDIRQLGAEWRKFWMNDRARHCLNSDEVADEKRLGPDGLKNWLLGSLMYRYVTLFRGGEYVEAERVAAVVAGLDPDSPTAAAALKIARVQRQVQEHNRKAEEQNRAKPVEVEIEKRLNQPVNLKFSDMPLDKLLDDIHTTSGINIFLDNESLKLEGINPSQPVSIALEGIPLKFALNLILQQVRLAWVIRDEALVITTKRNARGKLIQRIYSVDDLVGDPADGEVRVVDKGPKGEPRQEQLVRLIVTTLEPDTWSETGGQGTIDYFPAGKALVVNQTADVHEQVPQLLGALRRLQRERQAASDEASWRDFLDTFRCGTCPEFDLKAGRLRGRLLFPVGGLTFNFWPW